MDNVEPVVCPGCRVAYTQHWQCKLCLCFGHKNVYARYDSAICKACDKALAQRGRRRCRTCARVKLTSAFRGGRYQCKACDRKRSSNRAAQRAYVERNKAKLNAQARERYHQNPEPRRTQRRQTYQRNIAWYRAYNQRQYRTPARQAWRKLWGARNKARVQLSHARWRARRKLQILRGAANA